MTTSPLPLAETPPLALTLSAKDLDLSEDGALANESVEVGICVNPSLVKKMEECGAQAEGPRTWSVPVGASASVRRLEVILSSLPYAICWPADLINDQRDYPQNFSYYAKKDLIAEILRKSPQGTKALGRMQTNRKSIIAGWNYNSSHPYYGAMADQMVLLSSNGKRLWIKFCTLGRGWGRRAPRRLNFFDGAPDMNLWPSNTRHDKPLLSPALAMAVILASSNMDRYYDAEAPCWGVIDEQKFLPQIKKAMEKCAVIEAVAGSPGLCRVFASEKINHARNNWQGLNPDQYSRGKVIANTDNNCLRRETLPVSQLAEIWPTICCQSKRAEINPLVEDILAMSLSGENPLIVAGARGYQNEMIALHLATKIGAINACAPGLGKTFTTLKAFQSAAETKAAETKQLSALVVCPASITGQWQDETGRFFPEADARVFQSHELKDSDKLNDWITSGGHKVAIISYATARMRLDALVTVSWDELVCDEAAILRSTGSKQTKALHTLRQSAGRAIALTGTPIERSIDDLGRILAWARNDQELFYGQKLSRRYNIARPSEIEELWDCLGPSVFRRDRSEIASELPRIDTQVLMLDPTREEMALDQGARRNLKNLLEKRRLANEAALLLDPSNQKLQAEARRSAGGAILSGITLARMAAADPVAVAASVSKARDLLDDEGLIEPAVRRGGTKRIAISDLVCDIAQNGEGVLVFTDFATIATNLVEEIEANGIRVSGYTGKMNNKKRDKARRDFQGTPCSAHSDRDFATSGCSLCIAPTLDCLVLTEAGEEGLNLQRASTVIHFDLPWTASPVVQRVGRAGRIGANADQPIRNIIATMRGTIEERVCALLIPRAAVALAALDTARGIASDQTEIGLALSGVEATISEDEKANNPGLWELAHEVLG